MRMLIGLAVAVVFIAIGLAIVSYNAGFGPAIWPAMVPYALAPLAALGFRWLQAPSMEGRRVMDQIDGFKQYLSVAEEDRLEFLNPPKKTPELFERFLPYAIALHVENSWANRFTGVLAAAGVGAAVSSWYAGSEFSAEREVRSPSASATISRARFHRHRRRRDRAAAAMAAVPVAARAAAARRAAAEAVAAVPAGDADGKEPRRLSSGECRAQGVRCDAINGTGSGYSLMVRTLTGLLPGIASPLLSNALAVMVPAHPTFR